MTYVRLLYGSHARGEADALSDTDLLVIDDDPLADYTWSDMTHLRAYGSLFLWHLHLESVILDADEQGQELWAKLTSELPTYARVQEDLDAFHTVLCDVSHALQARDSSLEFEGAVLARTIRHVAILVCFLIGEPNFSRYSAVAHAMAFFGISCAHEKEFEELYDLVLRPGATAPGERMLAEWVKRGFALVLAMRNYGGGAR
jgi:hypothetical protein